MTIQLNDKESRHKLFPFTLTRHTADTRVGILTIREKWENLTGETISISNEDVFLNALKINSNLIPSLENYKDLLNGNTTETHSLDFPWQIFQYNDKAIRQDFELLTRGRVSAPISNTNQCISPSQVFIEEGASVEHSILNASTGPIYIGKNATVMEGCLVRGPFALCEGAALKMGARVYGATTLGPYCVGGGEIKNSVLFGYSNKAHDGYLGDSVLGEWCNLGAGTSNSNVKNTAGEVKYNTGNGNYMGAGNKAGLLMGDYSRAAINTSFNTGTVVGVCCNIFGSGMPGKYVPDFSWGDGRYDFEKALKDISNWKQMKGKTLTEAEKKLLYELYLSTK